MHCVISTISALTEVNMVVLSEHSSASAMV